MNVAPPASAQRCPEPSAAERRLYALWGEVRDLEAASEILGWDQETYMPEEGVAGRAKVMATLAGLCHEQLTSPALAEALDTCAEEAAPGSVLEAQVRVARRLVDRVVRVPVELARELAEAQSESLATWQEARRADDFAVFEPQLARLLDLKVRQAEAISGNGSLYDALLAEYEPGATSAQLVPLFDTLRQALVPLLRAVEDSGKEVDESAARGAFEPERQRRFGREVAEAFGFDFRAGRLDLAPHPFCSGFNRGDVRITWRYQEDDFRPALFGILHETGHGLYEQGLAPAWQRTPVGGAASLGVHESQSRLWENLVGRSRSFWRWALPLLKRHLPGTEAVTAESLWPALHTVRPSLIRVEADEATYNLHVAIRFTLESALFAGDLTVTELPAAWDEAYRELLGVAAPSAADGVLQDIHWAMGGFGYFPTYTLGTLASSQLMAAARRDLGDLDESFAAGDFQPLLGWLREKVHEPGSRWEAAELIERVTGKPLGPEDFLRSIRETTEQVYGVTV